MTLQTISEFGLEFGNVLTFRTRSTARSSTWNPHVAPAAAWPNYGSGDRRSRLLDTPAEQRSCLSIKALSSAACGGNTDAGAVFPLSTRGRCRCTSTPRTSPGAASRDKSLKNRGFETARADDQAAVFAASETARLRDEGDVGRERPPLPPPGGGPCPLQRGSLTPRFVRTKVTARRAKQESRSSRNGGRSDDHRLATRCALLQEAFSCHGRGLQASRREVCR